ncbi:uncharacterized protein LOC143883848 isoform X2 [Tasmannia lanceolata]|uniref:uncharacterized protein LOC143883848 isoform X2 n=1 Tax=Tasmannia lanceolata TaxID=3420 RepID=UPI004064698C
MGLLDFLYSSGDIVKRNAPDLTPVSTACRSSYNLGCAAVTKIDNAVRVDGTQILNQYLPDSEGWKKVGRISKNVVKYAVDSAVKESLKGVSGVQIYKIVKEELKDQNSPGCVRDFKKLGHDKELKEVKEKIEKVLEEMNKINEHNKILQERIKRLESPPNTFQVDFELVRKPEEVISLFMMKGFMGPRLLDALIVPKVVKERPQILGFVGLR